MVDVLAIVASCGKISVSVKTIAAGAVFITAACAKLTNEIISYTQSARIGLYLTPAVLTDKQEIRFDAGVLRYGSGQ